MTTYRRVIRAKHKPHGRMYSSFGMPNHIHRLPGICLRKVARQLPPRKVEARHSIHGCGLNTRMVRCRRLTQCSDRKKRHVRHVHSRLNLARQFATLRACFQKEFFIDEKVRVNRVQKQGSCVQIISGVQYKPDQARHKWNQLNVVTDALLDVALSASSTFMLPMPLIEEGVATCASP